MNKLIGILFAFVLVFMSCSKAPDHVIAEDDMAELLADIYKAEIMIEDQNNVYDNDSAKMMIRQSVFNKHNITQVDFDTSLIWYAHNLEVYDKVYDDAIKLLDKEYKELSKSDFTSVAIDLNSDVKPSMPRYRNVGDTADIWGQNRTWILLPGFKRGFISFDMEPDKENIQGDKYELAFKLNNVRNSMKVFLGVDYENGASSFVQRIYNSDGWKRCKLQSDSLQKVKRIYGYISYKTRRNHVSFVDSIELLRTHLDRNTYNAIMGQQKNVGQPKNGNKSEKEEVQQSKEELQSKDKVEDTYLENTVNKKELSPMQKPKRIGEIDFSKAKKKLKDKTEK